MTPPIDIATLGLETEEREIAMLLNQYATDIFDPQEGELSPVDEATVSLLLKRTAFIRFTAKVRLQWHPWFRRLAAAAAVVVVLASFLPVFDKTGATPDADSQDKFRMRGGGSIQAMISVEDNRKEEEDELKSPLAYLVDMQGAISVSRGGRSGKLTSSCELLSDGDVLEMGTDAKAKLMYEDAIFAVSGPMHYRVAAPSPVALDGEMKDLQINPQITTRGSHLGLGGDNALVIPPVALLAQIIPPTTRAGDAVVQVFSPRGACYGKCPSLGITGDPNSVYEVSVTDMESSRIGGRVGVHGGTTVDGKDLFTNAIEEDEIYTIRVTLDGKTMNELSTSTFWLVGNAERSKIDSALKHISLLSSDLAKDFFTANVLYDNGCYSEAYLLTRKLHDTEKGNMLYANLLKLCSKALKIKPERMVR